MTKILIYLIIFYFTYTLIKKALRGKPEQYTPRRTTDIKGEDLVLDPSCNKYVPKENALSVKAKGKVYYFCSEECRSVFKEKVES